MKLVGFLIMALFSQSCISEDSRTVSLTGKDLSLNEIFKAIRTQAGVSFFYDVRLLEDAKPVTINCKNLRLETALNEIFKDQPVNWALENKTVTIIKRPCPVKNRQDR